VQPTARRAAVAVGVDAHLAVFQGVDHAVPAFGGREGEVTGRGTGRARAVRLLAVARSRAEEVRAEPGIAPLTVNAPVDGSTVPSREKGNDVEPDMQDPVVRVAVPVCTVVRLHGSGVVMT